jgi:[ribosomal protein S5]-alanine N-acetyltransferase
VTIDLAPLFDTPPNFLTARLRIRPLGRSDADDLLRINRDPEVTRYLPYLPWKDAADAAARVDRMMLRVEARTSAQFAIELNRTDGASRVIGDALLFNFDLENEHAEVGYVLGREYWGRGYVVEALQPLIDFAFRSVGLHRLEATIDPRNEGSAKVLQRLGFVLEGLQRERWLDPDGRSNAALYGLLQSEWQSRL